MKTNSISKSRGKNTDHITCRLPITLKKKLEALAIKKNSNLNQLIKSAVEDFVEMKYEKKINEVNEEQQLLQNQYLREKNINIDLQKQISQALALLKEAKLSVKNLEESKIILEKTLQTNSTQIIELKENFDRSQSDLIKVLNAAKDFKAKYEELLPRFEISEQQRKEILNKNAEVIALIKKAEDASMFGHSDWFWKTLKSLHIPEVPNLTIIPK